MTYIWLKFYGEFESAVHSDQNQLLLAFSEGNVTSTFGLKWISGSYNKMLKQLIKLFQLGKIDFAKANRKSLVTWLD